MKKVILIGILFLVFWLSFGYSVLAQSTFKNETLVNAIENYVKSKNSAVTKVEIKQTLNTQKFSQKGVVASISHTGNLSDDCIVTLIFSSNEQVLTRLPVRINVTTQTVNKDNFKQVEISKGNKVKMLHYSGAICIRMDGVAMENGGTGDVIKVKNNNNQIMYGFIAEDGNVIIENKSFLGAK